MIDEEIIDEEMLNEEILTEGQGFLKKPCPSVRLTKII